MMLEEDFLWSPRDTEVLQTMKSGTSPSERWVIGFAQQCTIALTNNETSCMYLHTVLHKIWQPQFFLRIASKIVRQKFSRIKFCE